MATGICDGRLPLRPIAEIKRASPACDAAARSSPHGVAHAAGEGVGQVLAKQLLDEIERIEK